MLAYLHMNPGEIASFFTNNIIVHVSAFLPREILNIIKLHLSIYYPH
jgi:hypothetical protein